MGTFFDRIKRDAVPELWEKPGRSVSNGEPEQPETPDTSFAAELSDTDARTVESCSEAPELTPNASRQRPAATTSAPGPPEPLPPAAPALTDSSVPAPWRPQDSALALEREAAPETGLDGPQAESLGTALPPGSPPTGPLATPPDASAPSSRPGLSDRPIDDHRPTVLPQVAGTARSDVPAPDEESSAAHSDQQVSAESPVARLVAPAERDEERSPEGLVKSTASSSRPAAPVGSDVPSLAARPSEPLAAGHRGPPARRSIAQDSASSVPAASAQLALEASHDVLRLEVQELRTELTEFRQHVKRLAASSPPATPSGVHIRKLDVIVKAPQPPSIPKARPSSTGVSLADRSYLRGL